MGIESDVLRARARKGLAIYFAGVVLGAAVCEGMLFSEGGPITQHPLIALSLMWTPAMASLAARTVLREGARDVALGFRGRHGIRMLLLGWLYPLLVGGVAYGAAWGLGLDEFAAPGMASVGLEHAPPIAKLVASVGINLTLGTVLAAISAFGEELGWRGYMLTRLIEAGVPRPILMSGLIWAGWHLPMILSGQYAAGPHPVVSALLFASGVIFASYVAARVRLESGSLWPAVVFHSSWNALIQGTFDAFTRGGNAAHTSSIWIGESGIVVVVVNVLLALLVVIRPWPVRRFPRDEPTQWVSVRSA